MKKYFLTTFSLMLLGLSYGQTITGKVTDQQSNPILGATISFSNSSGDKGGVITGENGDFSLNLPQTGEYNLTISYIGYRLGPTQPKLQSKSIL